MCQEQCSVKELPPSSKRRNALPLDTARTLCGAKITKTFHTAKNSHEKIIEHHRSLIAFTCTDTLVKLLFFAPIKHSAIQRYKQLPSCPLQDGTHSRTLWGIWLNFSLFYPAKCPTSPDSFVYFYSVFMISIEGRITEIPIAWYLLMKAIAS